MDFDQKQKFVLSQQISTLMCRGYRLNNQFIFQIMTSPANLISLNEDDYLIYDDGVQEHMLKNGSENGLGDPHNADFVEFITEGVLLLSISILGFVGNALSIYVLLRPTLRGISVIS